VRARNAKAPTADFDALHKLPRSWRYFNISVLWIFYYQSVIRLLYWVRVRHEIVTLLSFACGAAAAALILTSQTLAGFIAAATLVHFKDVFDACDGALARLTGTGHRLGRFLDTLGDGVIFTLWIIAVAWRGIDDGISVLTATLWGIAAWFSLFLQCSYFNFHQLHYIRLSGLGTTSRFDERVEPASGTVAFLAAIYDLWFGWQDRLIASWDYWQRRFVGLPANPTDLRNNGWYGKRPFLVANSALCFGTYAFVLAICLLFRSPFLFLPAIVLGMNLYWVAIVLTRLVVFRRTA
jgi:phosphatidylglycerophosphate synthase